MRVKSQEGCYRRPLQGPKKKELARTQVQIGALDALNMPSIYSPPSPSLFPSTPPLSVTADADDLPPFTHLELQCPRIPCRGQATIIIDL